MSGDSCKLNQICKLFELLGTFLAKCIQDGRRVDIPLSEAFLKLICLNQAESTVALDITKPEGEVDERQSSSSLPTNSNASNNDVSPNVDVDTEAKEKFIILDEQEDVLRKDTSKESTFQDALIAKSHHVLPWFTRILTLNDVCAVDPYRGKFLLNLQEFVKMKKNILDDSSLSEEEKSHRVSDLTFDGDSKLNELMYVNLSHTN